MNYYEVSFGFIHARKFDMRAIALCRASSRFSCIFSFKVKDRVIHLHFDKHPFYWSTHSSYCPARPYLVCDRLSILKKKPKNLCDL